MKETFARETVKIRKKRLLRNNKWECCRTGGMRQEQAEKIQPNTANNSSSEAFIGLKYSFGVLLKLNNTAICWRKRFRVPVFPL